MASGHFPPYSNRRSGLVDENGGPVLNHRVFQGTITVQELLQFVSGLRSSLSIVANTPTPIMLFVFNGDRPEEQSDELRYALHLWEWFAGDPFRPLFCAIVIVILNPPVNLDAIYRLLPPRAHLHVFSLQVQVLSAELIPGRLERFISLFPHTREVYVQVVDVVESNGGIFTAPPGIPSFVHDRSIPVNPPLPRVERLSLAGTSLSPDTTPALQLDAVRSLSLYDQIIRDADYLTAVQLLARMPHLASFRCHFNWQFPDTQHAFWAPPSVATVAPLIQHIRLLDLTGFKDDVAGFYNVIGRASTYAVQTSRLLLRCDSSDTTPTFDEIDIFTDELADRADDVHIDVPVKTIKCTRRSGGGLSVTFDVTWELTNTSTGFWSTAGVNLVNDNFTEFLNTIFMARVPRTVSIVEGKLADLFDGVLVCGLRVLRLTGSMGYLRDCVPVIRANLDVFRELSSIYYTATPPFGLDTPQSYGRIVTDGESLDPLPATPRFVDVYLRVPSMLPVDGRYQLRTLSVWWNTSVPKDSRVILDPPTNAPF